MITVNGLHIPSHCDPVSPPRAYPEHYAKPYNFLRYEHSLLDSLSQPNETDYQRNKREFNQTLSGGIIPRCTAGYIKGSCNHEHTFYKAVFCGREYCPDCGRNGSLSHQRRVKRWNPKGQEMECMRYMVVTIPEGVRKQFFNTETLRNFRVSFKRKLKRMGFERGLMRYHFFGDCSCCEGKGCKICKGTGAGQKYHPHLNVLFEGGFMQKDEFKTFRAEINNYLVSYFKKVSGGGKFTPVFHLQYAVTPEEKAHKVKYVTRATFRVFDPAVNKLLKGFRAAQAWGEWPEHCGANYRPDSGELLEAGKCPCCVEEEQTDAGKIDWRQGGNFIEEIKPNLSLLEGVSYKRKTEPECVDDGEEISKKVIRTLYRPSELIEKGVDLYHISAGYYYAEEPDYYSTLNLKNKNPMANTLVPLKLLNQMAELRCLERIAKRNSSPFMRTQIKNLQNSIDAELNKLIESGEVMNPNKIYKREANQDQTLFQ